MANKMVMWLESASTSRPNQPAGLGWHLWAVALALPWLVPTHAAPWTTFHTEALMALVMLPAAVWALRANRGPCQVDALTAGVAAAAAIPPLQAAVGFFTFPAEALLVSMYLVAVALTLQVARQSEQLAPGRMVDALFAGLALAAIASSALALYQWLGMDNLGLLVLERDGRPYANVAQPNNLATMLVWGMVALWWGHQRQRIGGVGATLGAAFILLGVVLSESRTGLIEVSFLGLVAWFARRRFRAAGLGRVVVGLAVWLIFCCAVARPLSEFLLVETPRMIGDQGNFRERLLIWRMGFEGVLRHPMLGYGWNQIARAQSELAAEFPLKAMFGHAHNLLLDLMLWNGVPIALLMIAGLALWFRHALRRMTPEAALLLLALTTFLLHAMVELPHVFLFFLLPAAMMMGTLNAMNPLPVVAHVPRLLAGTLLTLLATVGVLLFNDLSNIEEQMLAARYKAARIVGGPAYVEPHILLMKYVQHAMLVMSEVPRRGMSESELAEMRRTVERFPLPMGVIRYARASAMNGHPEDAAWALKLVCTTNPAEVCEDMLARWREADTNDVAESAVVRLPVVPKP